MTALITSSGVILSRDECDAILQWQARAESAERQLADSVDVTELVAAAKAYREAIVDDSGSSIRNYTGIRLDVALKALEAKP